MVESANLQTQKYLIELCQQKLAVAKKLFENEKNWKIKMDSQVNLKSQKSPRDLKIYCGQIEVPFTPMQVF